MALQGYKWPLLWAPSPYCTFEAFRSKVPTVATSDGGEKTWIRTFLGVSVIGVVFLFKLPFLSHTTQAWALLLGDGQAALRSRLVCLFMEKNNGDIGIWVGLVFGSLNQV